MKDEATGSRAEGQAVERNEPLVRHIVRKFVSARSPRFDDLLQEGRIAGLKAFRTWSPEKSASLKTWTHRLVWWGVATAAKATQPSSQEQSLDALDLDGEEFHDTLTSGGPSPEVLAEVRQTLRLGSETLPPRTVHVLGARFVSGRTRKDVGSDLGLGRQGVNYIERSGLEIMRSRLKEAS